MPRNVESFREILKNCDFAIKIAYCENTYLVAYSLNHVFQAVTPKTNSQIPSLTQLQ